MKIRFFKSLEIIVFGVRYSKDLFMDKEHQLIFSFWKWDIAFWW